MILDSSARTPVADSAGFTGCLLDLSLYIAVMFLVREVYFESVSFIANALFWSFTTLAVASWRMKIRGVSWRDLGLRKPTSWGRCLSVSVVIVGATVASVVIFEIIKDQLPFAVAPDTSTESAVSRFGDLKDNWPLFFSIIGFVWVESMLEELLDRGFLMNWLESLFSPTSIATILAVVVQAALFGVRHFPSHGWSGAITVSLIGLIMGAAYMVFGRNLWPLVIAHGVLNTISMVERV